MRLSARHLGATCLVIAVLVILLRVGDTSEKEILGPVIVTLGESGFSPAEVHIGEGDTVTFVTTIGRQFWPASNLHPDHSIYPEFDPMRPLQPDERWSFTFREQGEWRFHDHLRSYFTGTVYVD